MDANQIEELFNRFSAGRGPDEKQDLRSSRIFAVTESPFSVWCDYHAPRSEALREQNRYDQAKSLMDKMSRDKIIKSRFPEVSRAPDDNKPESFRKTLELMASGAPAIEHPCLWDFNEHIYGRPSLIYKVEGDSVFGNYHYRIIQFKQAVELKEHYAIQAALLNRALGAIQGREPEYTTITLRYKEVEVAQAAWNDRLDKTMAAWRDLRDDKVKPEPQRPPKAALTPWRVYANRYAAETKDLVMLGGFANDVRGLLKAAHINNTDEVALAGMEHMQALFGPGLGRDVYASALAYYLNKPILKREGLFPPQAKERNLYFDFEDADQNGSEPSHTYLIGVWDKEQSKYVAFTAHGAAEEQKIFADFLDYIGDASKAVLYHWTEHETKAMKNMGKKHPELAERMKAAVAACHDLKISVQKSFYLPSPSLSLKAVAPALGFYWRQSDCGAMDSMIYYWDWLSGTQNVFQKVLMYNEDDCVAMLHVQQYLETADVQRL